MIYNNFKCKVGDLVYIQNRIYIICTKDYNNGEYIWGYIMGACITKDARWYIHTESYVIERNYIKIDQNITCPNCGNNIYTYISTKAEFIPSTNTPKFKIGDWVKHKINSKLYKLIGCFQESHLFYVLKDLEDNIVHESSDNFEIATPEKDEFWYIETSGVKAIYQFKKVAGYKYTGIKYCYNLTDNSTSIDIPFGSHFGDDKDITLLRPATKSEEQQLIKVIEKDYKVTWNGKEWVDCFKKGDYVYGQNYHCWSISIYGTNIVLFNAISLQIDSEQKAYSPERICTDKEMQLLNSALTKAGKRFNPEILKLEDIPKIGDVVIVWDSNKKSAFVSILKDIRLYNIYPYITINERIYLNAIKFISEQQYKNFIK